MPLPGFSTEPSVQIARGSGEPGARRPRAVHCARESQSQAWLGGLREAFAVQGVAVGLWRRDAARTQAQADAPQAGVALV
jgi:hypothetical protein